MGAAAAGRRSRLRGGILASWARAACRTWLRGGIRPSRTPTRPPCATPRWHPALPYAAGLPFATSRWHPGFVGACGVPNVASRWHPALPYAHPTTVRDSAAASGLRGRVRRAERGFAVASGLPVRPPDHRARLRGGIRRQRVERRHSGATDRTERAVSDPASSQTSTGTSSQTTAELMPAAFLGHGNPMNALADNRYTQAWHALGRAVPRPRRSWWSRPTGTSTPPR